MLINTQGFVLRGVESPVYAIVLPHVIALFLPGRKKLPTMQLANTKVNFNNSALYFACIFAVVILGFWPSYFARFFDGAADFSFYIHFHSTLMVVWFLMLILQPILIRRKNLSLHRLIGTISYPLFPLMCISIILVVHQTHQVNDIGMANSLLFQIKPFLIFVVGYSIAVVYRHNVDIHARGMVVTGIALIEPALTRLMLNILSGFELFVTSPNFFWYGSLPTIAIIFSCLIVLIIRERRQRNARWVFPLALGLYAVLYGIVILDIHIGVWESVAKWFISLPLT